MRRADIWKRASRRMARDHLAARGVTDRRLLSAMAAVPREEFVPLEYLDLAYADRALAIGEGQTISQPYMIAWMLGYAELDRHSNVLEIGTGSGYSAAILARLAGRVVTVERLPKLSTSARRRLATLGVDNVTCVVGDGGFGYPTCAPYDAILVMAAAQDVPPALPRQLKSDGRLIIPLGGADMQELTIIRQSGERYHRLQVGKCRFVPFISTT